jgi:hypothetical protein
MANPANLTVTDLVANDMVAQPVADVIDTDGLVPILAADLGGATGRIVIEVVNGDAVNALDVTVVHGENPPAVREGIGSHVERLVASGAGIFGPYESARFINADGTLDVGFATVLGVNAAATVRVYLLPKAV